MKIIFLDRDGVINRYPGDRDYVKSWEEFHFLPQAKSALKRLYDNGFKIFIISNQAGVSKGIYSQENLDLITKNMLRELEGSGVVIAGVNYCTHRNEDNCSCRKPKTGLIEKAVAALGKKKADIEFGNSYFIGDTLRDVEAGKGAGLETILVFSGKEKPQNQQNWNILPDYTAAGLQEAVDIVLNTNLAKE
jgi:histidinol-phosphate phosphatase family protein